MPVNIGDEIIRNVPEQVQKNMDDIAELENHFNSFQSQIDNCLKKASIVDNLNSTATNRPLSANMGKTLKDMLNQAIAGVFKYKGSVATYSDLPASDNVIGDTWNVLDTGMNYCWDGSAWDALASIIDTSDFASKSSVNTFTAANIFDQIVSFNNPVSYSSNAIMRQGLSTYGLLLPDTSLLSANSEILDTASTQTITSVKTFADSVNVGDGTSSASPSLFFKSEDLVNQGNWEIYCPSQTEIDIRQVGQGNVLKLSRDRLFPANNNYVNLGVSGYAFKDIYYAGTIRNGNSQITADGSGFILTGASRTAFNMNIQPYSDNTRDIGTSSLRFKDLYLSGVLSDGTNSVNIADLKALIDYARGQGWIV